MGTKRVGLARTQALIQNLKRELALGGSTITGNKLAPIIAMGAEFAVGPTNGANFDTSVSIPAGAMIVDAGFVVTELLDMLGGETITVSFGSAASYTDLVTGVVVNAAGTDILAGVVVSVNGANAATVGGNPFGAFLPAQVLYSAAAQTINMRCVNSAHTMTAAGKMKAWVSYILI